MRLIDIEGGHLQSFGSDDENDDDEKDYNTYLVIFF